MGILRKVWERRKVEQAPRTVLSVLEELNEGKERDYCFYVGTVDTGRGGAKPQAAGEVAIERLIIEAFAPLEVLKIDEADPMRNQALPDEAFLTLADHARVLWLIPTDTQRFIDRLRLLKKQGPLNRCIFLMPEQGTLGISDWPRTWETARTNAATLGIELSPYTAGGWLFRLDPTGKACTFRPITNPNVEKIARALEAICEQMME